MKSGLVNEPPPTGSNKTAVRVWAKRQLEKGIPKHLADATVDGIAEWFNRPDLPEGEVVIFFPLPDEIDLTPLIDRLDRTFVVTRTPRHGPLTLHPADGPMERHRFGYQQPRADAPLVDPVTVAVVLTPGQAFGRRGERLGRGAGYYDRFFAKIPAHALRVGVTVSALVMDEIPTEPHDVPMTHLATEEGVLRIGEISLLDGGWRGGRIV